MLHCSTPGFRWDLAQTYDGYSALHTPCIWLGIPERRMWILPHFKIPHLNTWIWCWSLKCRVLINRHKFRAWIQYLWWILRTLHSGFTLHTQDSPIQIHWVLSVECWVSVISLGPGLRFNKSDGSEVTGQGEALNIGFTDNFHNR